MSTVGVNLQQSLNRLSSGLRIVHPGDDAGGLAVSMKMTAAIKRQAAVSNNISNAMSYLHTQDGALESAGQILSRIGELKVMVGDVTKNATDRSNYETEFRTLQEQMRGLAGEKFNGLSLFSDSALSVKTGVDGGTAAVELAGVDLLGTSSAPFAPFSSEFDDLGGFSDQSTGTGTASVFGGTLNLGSGNNDLGQVDSDLSVSGAWELTYDFSKTDVTNDDLTLFLGGSEVFSYDAENTANHSVRIRFDGVNTAEIFLDGASVPTETNVVGANSGKLRLQLSSTVSGASAQVDDFSLNSSENSNNAGAVSAAGSLASLDMSALSAGIEDIATFRAQNGASQSRLQFAKEQLDTNRTNLEAANGRIIDVDVAVESTALARFNILQQAGASMLSQANQSQQVALKLIG